MTIETERLLLRPWEESDAEALYKYASHPEVGPMAGWLPHTSVENSLDVIRTILTVPNVFAIVIKENGGEPVGSIGCHPCGNPDIPEPEIGYWIGRPFWGMGYTSEALKAMLHYIFEDVGERRVWCCHFYGNDRSEAVIRRCGFGPEFDYNTSFPAVENATVRYYSVTRSEFESRFGGAR